MSWKKIGVIAAAACAVTALAVASALQGSGPTVLTGIVTTEEVVVSPQVAGRLVELCAREGDTVARGQVLAALEPAELRAQEAFYARTAEGLASEAEESAATLRYQERDAAARVRQAQALLAADRAERAQAAAQLEDARVTWDRQDRLARGGATTEQERDRARTSLDAARARLEALDRQVEAQQAAVEQARAGAEQVAGRRAGLAAARLKRAAAEAQRDEAGVRAGHTVLRAPIAGTVSVRAARVGEYVAAGAPVVTLVDPDDLWVRADVEEGAVDRVRLGDQLEVRLASGEKRTGTVFYRGVDAGFATQRDVSRVKRDIRTFELRLRIDNRDRRLALGSTASVVLPEAR